jgi:hypothetical protein
MNNTGRDVPCSVLGIQVAADMEKSLIALIALIALNVWVGVSALASFPAENRQKPGRRPPFGTDSERLERLERLDRLDVPQRSSAKPQAACS